MVQERVEWFGQPSPVVQVTVTASLDAIDLSKAVVHNSPADVASWAVTTKIKTLDLGSKGVFIDFDKKDGPGSWPDVMIPGWEGGNLQYTLWIALAINGKWHTSGCIQYWRGLDRNGGPPSGYARNWYYAADRWAPMTGHQPRVGEKVGFFVTAGNERNVGQTIVKERSNVVVVDFPADPGRAFKF